MKCSWEEGSLPQVGEGGRNSRKGKGVCKTRACVLGGQQLPLRAEMMGGDSGKGGWCCVTWTWGHVSGRCVMSKVGNPLLVRGVAVASRLVLLWRMLRNGTLTCLVASPWGVKGWNCLYIMWPVLHCKKPSGFDYGGSCPPHVSQWRL